jgi:hypothetical protein
MRKALILFLILFFVSAAPALALTGGIDSTNKYAYGENVGWLNLGTPEGNVQVGDASLTGYVWTENTGWVSLNCSNTSSCGSVNYGVTNDGSGNLSGYAWGENVGWISMSCANTSSCGTVNYGVTIDQTSGDFSGYAYGENAGWVSFNCSNTSSCGTVSYKVSLAGSGGQSTSTISGGSGNVQGGGGGINDEEQKLPSPKPMFPSGRPPRFTPPASSQVIQIIQPGKSQEGVSTFIIPAQIAQKIKLIFELTVSAIRQGGTDAENFTVRFWNSIRSLFKSGNKPAAGAVQAVPVTAKKYGAIDLYSLVNDVREVPELLPTSSRPKPEIRVQIKTPVDANQIQPRQKAQIILKILKSIMKPSSTTPPFPVPALPPPPPAPKVKPHPAQIMVPNQAEVLDSLQGIINVLGISGH